MKIFQKFYFNFRFFEEVLKNEGPIHISRVEEFYSDNKAIIVQAVPAFRNFRSE